MPVLNLSTDDRTVLATSIVKERDAAVKARGSDLTTVWRKARMQYRGEDITSISVPEKGETLNSPMTMTPEAPPKKLKSTVVVNITRPYTNAGTARVADILLPTAKLPFSLKQTPISDVQVIKSIAAHNETFLAALQVASPSLFQKITMEPEATKAATEAAFTQIKDWMKESNWAGATRKQINEAGQVGTGVIKGPFPKRRKLTPEIRALFAALPHTFKDDPNMARLLDAELSSKLEYTPHVECIKVENCFPDGSCGSNIQNGRYFFELVPEVTRRQLKEYMSDPTYDADTLQEILDEDPKSGMDRKLTKDSPYELWIRTGMLELPATSNGEKREYGFQVTTLINDKIVKSEAYWLDAERFPYHMLVWEPREGSWAGIGIPEQIETPQRGTNSATRALMDNMGYSVGPQVLEIKGLIEPKDGSTQMHAYKEWVVTPSITGDAAADAKNAMTFLEFPNYLPEIMPVIQFWLKMAEDTTGLSLLLQGQAVTDAVGVSQQLMNNSTTNLRQVVKLWDDDVCAPMVTDFYEWVQLFGSEEAKGDAVVEPLGSATLIVRELQQQALLQIGDRVLQPIYGISPQKWMQMYLEGFQVDYEVLAMTDEERERLEAAEKEPDVKVQVAEIEAAVDMARAEMVKEIDEKELIMESLYKNMQAASEMAERQLTERIAMFTKALDLEGKDKELAARIQQSGAGTTPAPTPTPTSVEPGAVPVEVDKALAELGLV